MFQNKTVIVTGAGDMPCSEIAVELARQGAQVLLIDRERDKLAAVQKRIQEIGGRAQMYECDVNNASAVAQLAQEIKNLFGWCDYLINSSGGELVKLFSANTDIKIHAEGSYIASWVEKRAEISPPTTPRAPRFYHCM
ncbi:MAG: SDR family NAD(P)-dependent oxidoreductase [Clostridia bacterium]|nr:SDR family NAD(P)-dependent oxidoreductase [Clostridia bacterium]